jgi:hypothetical protein
MEGCIGNENAGPRVLVVAAPKVEWTRASVSTAEKTAG